MEKQIQHNRNVCYFKLSLAPKRKTFPTRHILSSGYLFLKPNGTTKHLYDDGMSLGRHFSDGTFSHI